MFDNRSGETPIFSCYRSGAIVLLKFKPNLVQNILTVDIRELFIDFFKRFSADDSVKVIILLGSREKNGRRDYFNFYRAVAAKEIGYDTVESLYHAINQFVRKLAAVNKYVIHADRGNIDVLFFGISLACDYRILSSNSVLQTPYHELGLLPKGGIAYFLPRITGSATAAKFLMRKDDITAKEALALRIVDRIVPDDKLEEEAVKTAMNMAAVPDDTLLGIKKLLNFSPDELNRILEMENQELKRIVRTEAFMDRVKKTTATHFRF